MELIVCNCGTFGSINFGLYYLFFTKTIPRRRIFKKMVFVDFRMVTGVYKYNNDTQVRDK